MYIQNSAQPSRFTGDDPLCSQIENLLAATILHANRISAQPSRFTGDDPLCTIML
ncbi:MAG: hypothetical protein Q7S09_06010 [bacterium]|nr:hypothetical protein [bacterium]